MHSPLPDHAHRLAASLAQSPRVAHAAQNGSAAGAEHGAERPADPRLAGPYPDPHAAPPSGGYQRYREMTLDELLLENRVVFLVGEINHATAMGVVMRLLYLENTKPGVDINLYVNSPGGRSTTRWR